MPIVTPYDQHDQKKSTIDNEINHFNALAKQWWNRSGPMKTLHDMNDIRIRWIETQLKNLNISKPTTILDIGCGAGLASEKLAKLGYDVIGVDAATEVIEAAKSHLQEFPLPTFSGKLTYRVNTIENLCSEPQRFAVINALELLEHVENPKLFISHLAHLLIPSGKIFVSTVNRNLSSLLLAKIGAEYIARLLPIGTHHWKQFITPKELANMAHQAGLRMVDITGLSMKLKGWQYSVKPTINYIVCLSKD